MSKTSLPSSRFARAPTVEAAPSAAASYRFSESKVFAKAPWDANDSYDSLSAANNFVNASRNGGGKKVARQAKPVEHDHHDHDHDYDESNEDAAALEDAYGDREYSRNSVPFPVCATQGVDPELPRKISAAHGEAVNKGLLSLLVVNTDSEAPNSGNPVIWGPGTRQQLTWAIDRSDGEQRARELDSYAKYFRKAFDDWQATCGVKFVEVSARDWASAFIKIRWANDDEEEAGRTPSGNVIAAAFFPGEDDRSVKIYQAFKTYRYKTSVLRHEFGHALGFRHEHPWAPDADHGPNSEGTEFTRQLTKYDPNSIMNYRKMQGDNRVNRETFMSELDKYGSRLMYGAPFRSVNFL